MSDQTKVGFEGTIHQLLAASPKNSSKADPVKAWVQTAFNIKSSVARITEDKQLGNRITEQFAHQEPIVIFVLEPGVNCDSLATKVTQRRYPKLDCVLLMRNTAGVLTYEKLLVKNTSMFSQWCEQKLDVNSEMFSGTSNVESFEELGPYQQIFYGAPGTGKSWKVDQVVMDLAIESVRTTFHPDSDYSAFVGAYKPTMKTIRVDRVDKHLTVDQLAAILKKEYESAGEGSDKGKALAVDLYAEEYFEYLDGEFGKVSLAELVNKAGLTKGYAVGLRDSINVAKYHALQRQGEEKISYEFVPQAFMQAYVAAWKKWIDGSKANVVLVIEEINRGNCAQIFGDLFQLLDRNDVGWSSYPIVADHDLAKWLKKVVVEDAAGKGLSDLPCPEGIKASDWEAVKRGEILLLPPNLYIWATMNTSDQSLFPMDSAFKRRWEWKYVPIAKPDEPNWKDRKIKVGSSLYDWWDFLTIINKHIAKATESEDKQLGYFFVKAPDDTGLIAADQFANKVLFYLYGDVFKSYDLPAAAFKRDGGAVWAFRDFFYSETAVVLKADGQIVKDADGNVVKTVTDETMQILKKPGDVNELELTAFLDHLKWKDASGEKSVGKESAGADV